MLDKIKTFFVVYGVLILMGLEMVALYFIALSIFGAALLRLGSEGFQI